MIHFKPWRFGKAEIAVITVCAILVGIGLGVATVPWVATWYGRLTDAWTHLALQYGYWGAFWSAIIGSVTIVIVFPYTLIVFFLATQGLNPLWLGALMGLGATIGQMSGYLIGMTGSRFVQHRNPQTYKALEKIVAARPGMIEWLIFFFAITPLPDDMLFIPLGLLRYRWWRLILPTLAGKVLSGLIVTSFSHIVARTLDTKAAAPATAIVSQLGTFIAIAIIIYVIFKLDWDKMMHRLLERHVQPIKEHHHDQRPVA